MIISFFMQYFLYLNHVSFCNFADSFYQKHNELICMKENDCFPRLQIMLSCAVAASIVDRIGDAALQTVSSSTEPVAGRFV